MSTTGVMGGLAVALTGVILAVSFLTGPDPPTIEVEHETPSTLVGWSHGALDSELMGSGPPMTSTSERRAVSGRPGAASPVDREEEEPAISPGRVLMIPVDAQRSGLLHSLEVRFLSAERFATLRAEGLVEASLTPGLYRASLSAPGFETTEVGPFAVIADETTDLGPVRLDPGAGTLEGRVSCPARVACSGWSAVLRGSGRLPCHRCGAEETAEGTTDGPRESLLAWERDSPCPACGFAEEESRVSLSPDGRFVFPGLASGSYFLEIFDADDAPIEGRAVDLRPFEACWLDIHIRDVEVRTLEVDLYGEDGRPFDGVLQTGDDLTWGTICFGFYRDGELEREALIRPWHHLSEGGYSLVQLTVGRTFVVGVAGDGRPGSETLIDRPRTEEDSLSPCAQERAFMRITSSQRIAPGRFEISSIPSQPMEMIVHCGSFWSDPIALDPSWHFEHGATAVMRGPSPSIGIRPTTAQVPEGLESLWVRTLGPEQHAMIRLASEGPWLTPSVGLRTDLGGTGGGPAAPVMAQGINDPEPSPR